MDLNVEIRRIAESKLIPGQFIVDIVASGRPGQRKISIIVDADQGMDIDACAELSRQVSKTLDETSLVSDAYLLEVSTPGVDQPLKLKRQYVKNVGRRLKIKLQDKTLEGKLTEVGEDNITLVQEVGSGKKQESVPVLIPLAAIEKAFVLVSFK